MKKSMQEQLVLLSRHLIDQHRARIVVEPEQRKPGYWFGGGNIVESADGTFFIVGRYRNAGDSTTGLGRGDRGLELAVFSSSDRGTTFSKILGLTKSDLSRTPGEVVSIEGTALNLREGDVELFVSTEKNSFSYPRDLAAYQKPGTGVWTIDRMTASDIPGLRTADVMPLISSHDPGHLHVKDPVIHTMDDGSTMLVFCTHPFNWSSSNSAYCIRDSQSDSFHEPDYDFFSRGVTWDVAATRITSILSLDGSLFGEENPVQLVFYDGAECLRVHDQNPAAFNRPRGYSCEELGGLAYTEKEKFGDLRRLSKLSPFFLSPWGTGSSRYVHTAKTANGIIATWQQSQDDGSQPLVMNFLSWDEIEQILRD